MHLTTAQRRSLPRSAFALPDRDPPALPLTDKRGRLDRGHVTSAAARLSMMKNRRSLRPGEYAYARRRIDRAQHTLGAHEEHPMSSNLARRSRENPGAVGTALWIDGVFTGGGAAVGALTSPGAAVSGGMSGAQVGLWIPTVAGAVVGFLSPDGERRDVGFATAGVGLLGLLAISLVNRFAMPTPTQTVP